jgi:hypothetical protein
MRAPPTGPMIEPFLVSLDAFPTKEMLSAVGANEFNHVISDSIATLAALDGFMFRHQISTPRLLDFLFQTFEQIKFRSQHFFEFTCIGMINFLNHTGLFLFQNLSQQLVFGFSQIYVHGLLLTNFSDCGHYQTSFARFQNTAI